MFFVKPRNGEKIWTEDGFLGLTRLGFCEASGSEDFSEIFADQRTSKNIPHYGGSRGTSGLKMVPRVVGERARLLIEAQLGEREVRRTSQWQREAGNLRQNWPMVKNAQYGEKMNAKCHSEW